VLNASNLLANAIITMGSNLTANAPGSIRFGVPESSTIAVLIAGNVISLNVKSGQINGIVDLAATLTNLFARDVVDIRIDSVNKLQYPAYDFWLWTVDGTYSLVSHSNKAMFPRNSSMHLLDST